MGTACYRSDGPADTIRELLTAAQVAQHYGFQPNRSGYICCPFHRENTPSLKLYPGDKGWHCFGCGKGGDVIRFVMELFDLNFPQAVVRLDADFGLGLALGQPAPRKRSRLLEERRRAEEERQALLEQHHALAEEYRCYFEVQKYFAPVRDGWEMFIHPLYAEAVKSLPALEWELDEIEEQLERGRHGGATA